MTRNKSRATSLLCDALALLQESEPKLAAEIEKIIVKLQQHEFIPKRTQ